jgi:DNA topoisomerase-1
MSLPARPVTDPQVSAKIAGLHYISDSRPGIRRIGSGRVFRYIDAYDRVVRDPDTLRRIKRLAIPPAWKDVWISPDPDGHLQAAGRDARGRKQYRYHSRWREVRDSTKYHRMLAFGKVLPKIRRRVVQDLASPGLNKNKVLATIVRLLEMTSIRVGNEEYTKQNDSFGLTTLRNHHVAITGERVSFYFRGKSGRPHRISIADRHLARVVKRLRDLPGYELFQYVDEAGVRGSIGSTDVNDYLREITGEDFTAKDFRTWNGTVLAAQALCSVNPYRTKSQARKNIVRAVEMVAERLGNTVAVCRKCYIHPALFDSYMRQSLKGDLKITRRTRGVNDDEAAVLCFLQKASKSKAQSSLEKSLMQSLERVARKI